VTAQAISGVILTHGDVAEVVAALDWLMKNAWQHRDRVPDRIVAMRRELAESGAYATTYVDVSVDAPEAVDGSQFGPGVVDTATAARELGIGGAGVRDLIRRGRLAGMRIGGRWWIVAASIDAHKARNRKGA
jgi:hypothetical protein